MPHPTHGSDLSLAPTLGPLARSAGLPNRKALSAIGAAGFAAVQLDAALPGLRPRELDSNARRDLLVTARRAGLAVAGVDLFIPRQHLLEAEYIDRAAEALLAAIGFAAELGRVPLSTALPVAELDGDLSGALTRAADVAGVTLVVHAGDQHDALARWVAAHDGVAGMGIDPAEYLAGRQDPVALTQQALGAVAVARLSDTRLGLADGSRQTVGSGDLDLMGYRISADLAPRRLGPVVLDLRHVPDPQRAMAHGRDAWERAAASF
jgi:hypothetical protein